MHAFFATYDLRLSVYFTTLFMHSFEELPLELLRSSLWNCAILFTTLSPSKTFCQSSDFKLSIVCLNYNSGFLNGSSGAL
jgi:hypothetical protein